MSALDRYTHAGSLLPRDQRTVGRSLSRMSGQQSVNLARIDAVAELQAIKVEAAAQVAGRAMQSVAILTQLESQLTQTVPLAASRLQAIGDMAALAAADIVADTTWKLKRC